VKFLSLSATNFMSFKSFDFAFPISGLYFIGGEISGSTASNSNGAGKSSLAEALCFGLYGQTIRNSGKDDVVNWSVGKDCFVEVVLEDDQGSICVIQRYRNHTQYGNELRLFRGESDITGSDVRATQETIEAILGYGWQVFSSAIIFGERAKGFAEATDAEKKRIFDEILMLQQYQEAQVKVKVDIKELNQKIAIASQRIELVSQVCQRDEEDAVKIEQSLAGLVVKRAQSAAEIGRLDAERSQLLGQDKTLTAESDEHNKELAELQTQSKIVFQQYRTLETEKNEKVQEESKDYNTSKIQKAELVRKIDKINRWLTGVEKMPQSERCPTCGQSVSEESAAEVLVHYGKEIENHNAVLKTLDEEIKEADTKITAIRIKYDAQLREALITKDELEGMLQESNRRTTELLTIQNKNRTRVAVIDQSIKHLKAMAEAEERPLLEQKKALQLSLAKHNAEKETVVASKDQLLVELPLLEFWSEGFGNKGIKSFLLDEVVPLLNGRVSYYASSLLDEDVTIAFDTESFLKSGETRDKFNIRIQMGDQVVDYKQLSSGEKGRVDTAVLLSLQSLIFGRSTRGSNLVIMDELFEHLDITGIERVVNLLKEESKDKSIFVISHLNELSDHFDNVLMVCKKDGFSSIDVAR